MNKRGFLLAEETLKMIIALISIGFLVYLLSSLYFANAKNKDFANAEATLKRISEIIANVENKQEDVSDPAPVGWILFSFVGEEKKPNQCSGQSCLCLCNEPLINFGERQLNECSNKGVCEIVEGLQEFENIEIKRSPFVLEILKSGGIFIREK